MLEKPFPEYILKSWQGQYACQFQKILRKSLYMLSCGFASLPFAGGRPKSAAGYILPELLFQSQAQNNKGFRLPLLSFSLFRLSWHSAHCMVYNKIRQEEHILLKNPLPATLLLHPARAATIIKNSVQNVSILQININGLRNCHNSKMKEGIYNVNQQANNGKHVPYLSNILSACLKLKSMAIITTNHPTVLI